MDINGFPAQQARTQRFTLGVPRAFTLSPDGRRVLFLRTRSGEDRTSCLWLLDDDKERLLVAPESLGATGDIPEAERIRQERVRERAAGVVGYATDTAMSIAVFAVNGQLWVVDTHGGELRWVPTAGPVTDPRPDPTGSRVAYVTDGAMHVVELADGKDRQLAAPESPDVTWGLAEHVAAESMHRQRGYWWSPDGTHLLAAKVDTSPVQRWWIADPADPSRPPREIAYPAAGTANADVSLHVVGLDGKSVELSWDRVAYEYVTSAGWDEHGLLVGVQSRDQRTLRQSAAVAPAADGNPAQVELGAVLGGRPQRHHLVFQWRTEGVAVDRLLPGRPPPRSAAPVRDDHREPVLGEPLRLDQPPDPAPGHRLHRRPAVRRHQYRQRVTTGPVPGRQQQRGADLPLTGTQERDPRYDDRLRSERLDLDIRAPFPDDPEGPTL